MSAYRARTPTASILYQAVHEHWPAFLTAAAESERSVPQFVQREVDAFMACGIIERGAIRVACPHCSFERLVPFSCKSRSGLCSSCGARRMIELAEYMSTRIISNVPVRQWVLTVAPPIRYLLAYNTTLLSEVVSIFVHAVFDHLRRIAHRELGIAKEATIEPAAVCVPQRFNSALGLSPHLHTLVTDGVWIRSKPDDAPVFHALRAPTKPEISAVAWSCCERTIKRLKKRGLWLDADPSDDRFAQDEPLLASLAQASIAGLLVMKTNEAARPMRLYGRAARGKSERANKGPKNAYGFDLDAATRTSANDSKGRERLCRYLLRPPLAKDRLIRRADGKFQVNFRRVWDDGTSGIVLCGKELMARLVLLIHPPRIHTVRYYGAWARRSKLRPLVTYAQEPQASEATERVEQNLPCIQRGHRFRMSWAQALAKVFEIDVTVCPNCKRKGMRRIAVLHDPKVLRAIADALKRKGYRP